jgi:uncharacterized membrane protein
MLGHVSPTATAGRHVADIVAALAPPPAPTAQALARPAASTPSLTEIAKRMAPGVIGGVVGMMLWKRHPVLGFLAGHAVGAMAYPLYKGDKKRAMCNLAVEGTGIAGALYYRKHPALGYIMGASAGAVATYFVDGSPMKEVVAEVKRRF